MAVKTPLFVPSKRVTGFVDVDVFWRGVTNEDYSWAGLLPRPSQVTDRELPIAWTDHQQAEYGDWGGTSLYHAFYDGAGPAGKLQKNIVPTVEHGQAKSLLRRPRVVLLNVFNSTGTGLLDSIEDAMKAAGVYGLVSQNSFGGSGVDFILTCPFLPNSGVQSLFDTMADSSSIETVLPTIDHEEWLAGEILYIQECDLDTASAPTGKYTDVAFVPTWAEYTNAIAAGVQLVQDGYSRYARFGYHMTHPSVFSGGPPNDPAPPLASFNSVLTTLEDYGVTGEVITGTRAAGVAAAQSAIRNKIVEFFDL